MSVKKRKVPEPFKFSSREDELLIDELQKHVEELAAKKIKHQKSTKSLATGIVPGYNHVYSSAQNCELSNLYNSGFTPVLSVEFNHPQNTKLNYLLCNGLSHLPNTGFSHVQTPFWANSFKPVSSNGLVPIYNPDFKRVFNTPSSSVAYSNLISNNGFSTLIE